MLRCGVRLFEYPHTLLHQKVITIDGRWCAVGSANFDDRSFEINDELVVSFVDRPTAQALDAIFGRYAREAREITLDVWRARGWRHRLIDHFFYMINEVL
jgi:cardiolipin synthase